MLDEKRLYQALGKRIRALREQPVDAARGRMTQAELAKLVEMERTSITNIEKGNQKVPLHVLFRIGEVLGAEPMELLPSLSEVQSLESKLTELSFGGHTFEAPPLLAGALTALIANLEESGSSNGR
ncbi:helix-turn-helix domain-containing protein [Thiomonas sp. FB-6]|uniref:helix-turn-helix domain-containing protein n=1 Tax=Thiomonas sp. FB-6 TaxID=1158291 RepID=UPI0003726F83|nr:helix-turn-helix transcriptional regulator [Thiomonas sp. FB-6]